MRDLKILSKMERLVFKYLLPAFVLLVFILVAVYIYHRLDKPAISADAQAIVSAIETSTLLIIINIWTSRRN